jgi:hypothetical protein
MKRFLLKLLAGFGKLALGFVLFAIVARFVDPVNWFFFQKNQHDRVFYTLYETEKALKEGQHYDVLILGSSVCENAINPEQFSKETGLSTFKFVTAAQTIDLAAVVARFLAPKFQSKYVILDAYPRFSGGYTEEAVEHIVLNSPDATSPLILEILKADPTKSMTTRYLWAARAVGTFVKAYPESSIEPKPEFTMAGPGYTIVTHDPPMKAKQFSLSSIKKEAILSMNQLHKDIAAMGKKLWVIVPPIQNGAILFDTSQSEFSYYYPKMRPDTCFFDHQHLRNVCTKDYTIEVAHTFMRFLGKEAAPQENNDSIAHPQR